VDIIVFDAIGEGIDKLRTNVNKILNSKSSQEIYRSSKLALSLIRRTDDLSQLSNEVRAYALNKIDVDKIMNNYYLNIEQTHGAEELLKLIKNTEIDLREVPIDKNINPLKIGIIGEIYTIIEPFANLEIEKKLGDLNVLVEKSLTPTIWLEHHVLSYPFGSKHENMKHKLAEQYLKNPVGGHGRETVGSAIYYKSRGFDGVIQILPLNCMPEIVAKSILKTVEKDEDFPIMTLVVDEMTGEAGYLTRLEAFIDLINKRREKCIG
jgi:predicted nucleotide-binding protein (sugar kinase/HSP70/actin superfamily)